MSARARYLIPCLLAAALLRPGSARAETVPPTCGLPAVRPVRSLFDAEVSPGAVTVVFASATFAPQVDCTPLPVDPHLNLSDAATPAAGEQGPPARAFEYSEAYELRASIHRKASYAMLPLFVTEAVLGQKMFNNPVGITRNAQMAHRVIGVGIGGLFAVNTVTGVMNLWEGRKDPNGLMKRTIHATLMMMADVGFLATAATRPNSSTLNGLTIYDARKNQHMAIAYASITSATIGYVMMLFH
jgi:hypothetical protein